MGSPRVRGAPMKLIAAEPCPLPGVRINPGKACRPIRRRSLTNVRTDRTAGDCYVLSVRMVGRLGGGDYYLYV